MKLLTLSLFSLIASASLAANKGYELKMDLSLDGKHVSSPIVRTKAGETATVTQSLGDSQTFMDIIATEGEIQGHSGILLDVVIGNIEPNGSRKVLSRPKLLVKENEEASIEQRSETNAMQLKVVAHRTTL